MATAPATPELQREALARARELRAGSHYAALPDVAERALRGWQDRLRRIVGSEPGRGFDDAA